MNTVPPGIGDVPALTSWLTANVPGGPFSVTDVRLITGGRSNLTYRLTVAAPHAAAADADASAPAASAPTGYSERTFVLRRPPLGHVLPTAHDMSREFRVISALAPTSVPVAQPIAACQDTGVIGAPFYLMEFVPGHVLRTRDDAGVLTAAQAADLSAELARMLGEIHCVDVGSAGLGDLGKGAGYLRRQLDRWQRQWQLSATRELPAYDTLVARLAAGMPEEGEITLVHGDFRLDNVLVDLPAGPRIAAVCDWEMATLGDPLADLGLTLVYWTDPGEENWLAAGGEGPALGVRTDATTVPGFLSRAEFAAAYAARTGRDISRIGYYRAFGFFKLAVVMEGINARFLANETVGEGFQHEGQAVPILIARAHETLDTLT